MFDKFRKPTLQAKLINKGSEAKVSLINISAEQTMLLLYMAIKQIAISLRMDPRALMNRLVDLDKTILKNEKKSKKTLRFNK